MNKNKIEVLTSSESISNLKSKFKWYTLYTKPRFEKCVEKELVANGFECYLPLHRTPRVWSDRIKLVDMPLFSSYIFVKCKEHEIQSLVRTTGVARVVFYDNKPAIIHQREIDAIKEFIEVANGKVLRTGDNVEIMVGSMKNKSGKIIKVKKKYFVLHIEQLSAIVCVNIENVAPFNRLK